MKIKKITKSKNKLLKLKLIQNKIYGKKQQSNNIKIQDIEYRLKKMLYVIYKYHVLNKKILFVGSPLTTSHQIKNLLKTTRHTLIPKSIWVQGIISNNRSVIKHFFKKKMLSTEVANIVSQLKKDFHLIVILEESNHSTVLNESYIARIPIISINCNLNIHNTKPSYKVPGNFQFNNKKILDNFFYSLLITVLKKGTRFAKYLKKIQILRAQRLQARRLEAQRLQAQRVKAQREHEQKLRIEQQNRSKNQHKHKNHSKNKNQHKNHSKNQNQHKNHSKNKNQHKNHSKNQNQHKNHSKNKNQHKNHSKNKNQHKNHSKNKNQHKNHSKTCLEKK